MIFGKRSLRKNNSNLNMYRKLNKRIDEVVKSFEKEIDNLLIRLSEEDFKILAKVLHLEMWNKANQDKEQLIKDHNYKKCEDFLKENFEGYDGDINKVFDVNTLELRELSLSEMAENLSKAVKEILEKENNELLANAVDTLEEMKERYSNEEKGE